MKRCFNWQVILGLILITLSLIFYAVEYFLFRDLRNEMMYFFSDLAFVFVQVLLVTLVLNSLLTVREKRALLKKMNMVIGAFYSEAGTELIGLFNAFDAGAGGFAPYLVVTNSWSDGEFADVKKKIANHQLSIDCARGDLRALKECLVAKRQFLLGLLENPNLLEHASFTNLLWAVFHLTEELANRKDLTALPKTDADHLAGDIKRAYGLLVGEWLSYMVHLKSDYPYLFSLAMRTNPFDPNASVIVK